MTVHPVAATAWTPGLDALPAAVVVADDRLRIVEVNRTLCEWLDRPATELIGREIDQVLAPASRVMLQSYLLPLLELHGQVEEFAATLASAGTPRPDVLVYARWAQDEGHGDDRPRAGASGRRLHLLAVRHRARRQVEDDLLRIQKAADQSPGLIFQALSRRDGSLQLPYASEGLRRLFGMTPLQARRDARPLLRRVHPQDQRRLRAEVSITQDVPRLDLHQTVRVREADRQWRRYEIQAHGRRVDATSWIWHGHVSDVTGRLQLQQAMHERDLAERSRAEQLQFLTRLSHELRTPLNGILGFAQLLLDPNHGPPLSAEHREPVSVIARAGHHLLRMIDDVLQVSRLETGQFSIAMADIPVQPVVADAVRMARASALNGSIEVTCLHADGTPGELSSVTVRADPDRLRQVLDNLLSNALKYNHRANPRVEVIVRPADDAGRVAIEVKDDGPGLDARQRVNLFQPFNRLGAERTSVTGTGLGLVICRQLVMAMDGSIEVDSAPEVGSRFMVQLRAPRLAGPGPRTPEAVARSEVPFAADTRPSPPAMPTTPSSQGSGRPAHGEVLYVEDDPVNALLMSALAEMRPGIQLTVVGRAEDALRAAAAGSPRLLLLDRHLPDGDGLMLLQRIRQLPGLERVPALMVSAAAGSHDIDSARAAGFDGYWTKPLDIATALADLDRLLGPAGSKA